MGCNQGVLMTALSSHREPPRMVQGRPLASRMAKPNGSFHAAAKATEAADPETTEATTAASRRIAGRPLPRRYEPTRMDAMVAFAKGWRRQ
jgi:hypothetical protein